MRRTEALQGVRVTVFLNLLHRWESAELNQEEAAELLVHRRERGIHGGAEPCECSEMAQTVSLLLSAQHCADLQGVVEDRGRRVKHGQRAQIILLSAARLPVLEIAKRVGISRPMVWRWQQRFAEEGLEGLLRDKTRPPGIPPVPQAEAHAVVERTLREPPGAVTHWTGRAMAKAMGLSLRTIQRIWTAHKLQPHRIRAFKRSTACGNASTG
jgi:hypothetical protein